jgi:hypothetical protein
MQEPTQEEAAEASIPDVIASGDSSLNQHHPTVTVHRKAAKRSEKWYHDIAAPLPPSPQTEDIPARKKPRIKEEAEDIPARKKPRIKEEAEDIPAKKKPRIKGEPLIPLRRSPRRVNATSSTGIPAAPTTPPNATVVASTRRRSPRQTKLPRTETSEGQLDDDDEDEDANPDDAADDDDADDADLSCPPWEARLSELANYHKIYGRWNVSNIYSESSTLGAWVGKQRHQYRLHLQGKISQMSTLRIQALERLGFEWDSRGAAWEGSLSELADYRKIHGHCNVPRNSSEHAKLGRWVNTQRHHYLLHVAGNPSHMTPSRIKALENVDFIWESHSAAWDDRFSELADYRNIHGHCNVPKGYSENPRLAKWAAKQRYNYKLHQDGKKSFLTTHRIQALKSLGFE